MSVHRDYAPVSFWAKAPAAPESKDPGAHAPTLGRSEKSVGRGKAKRRGTVVKYLG